MEVGKPEQPRCVRFAGVMRWHVLAWERGASGRGTLMRRGQKSTASRQCFCTLLTRCSPFLSLTRTQSKYEQLGLLPTRRNTHGSEEKEGSVSLLLFRPA